MPGCHGWTPLTGVALSYSLSVMVTRINARIDDALASRLDAVQRRTGSSMTELVRRGLVRVCDEVEERADALEIFERHGFVGCGDGVEDGATQVKERVRHRLRQKA